MRRAKIRPPAQTDANKKPRHSVKPMEALSEVYCRFCGLHSHLHPNLTNLTTEPGVVTQSNAAQQESLATAIPTQPPLQLTCPTFNSFSHPELPIMDVTRLVAATAGLQPSSLHPSLFDHRQSRVGSFAPSPLWSSHALLSVANPQLVRSIETSLVSTRGSSALDTLLNRPRNRVEDDLAPSALLALVGKLVVKTLTRVAVETYREDEAALRGQGRSRARRDVQIRRLLTPMHVMRGLVHDAQRDAEAGALLLSLVPMGLSLPEGDQRAPV